MLTVRDIANLPGLGLELAAGAAGADNPIRWVHVSELPDPTPWLEGGELLITTGLGVGELSRPQREYVRRLAGHGLAGLAFGVGFGWAEPPAALADEAERLDFPLVTVPYEVPFIALTKAISSQLANAQLARARARARGARAARARRPRGPGRAGAARDPRRPRRLRARARRRGRAASSASATARRLAGCEHVLELPVVADGETWSLRAGKPHDELSEYDRLVLHHGQSALAFELSRRHAVSAAELRLAGDLLEDLEHDRLDEREIARRIAAFGLDPQGRYAALLAVAAAPRRPRTSARPPRGCSTRAARATSPPRAATAPRSSSRPTSRRTRSRSRGSSSTPRPGTRVGVGRPASGAGLGRSLLEARAALDAVAGPVASYQDLGSLELLLSLPDAALEAFVARVLGPAAGERLAARVARGAARHRLPLERGRRPARRPPAHAPLPDGAAAQADRAPPRRPVPAHGALARRQGQAGARGARGSRAGEPARREER